MVTWLGQNGDTSNGDWVLAVSAAAGAVVGFKKPGTGGEDDDEHEVTTWV